MHYMHSTNNYVQKYRSIENNLFAAKHFDVPFGVTFRSERNCLSN